MGIASVRQRGEEEGRKKERAKILKMMEREREDAHQARRVRMYLCDKKAEENEDVESEIHYAMGGYIVGAILRYVIILSLIYFANPFKIM